MSENFASATACVYVRYNIDSPPPHPGKDWTRFVCISDTHSRKFDVPKGDVLLHSGDLSSWGYLPQLETTMKWLESLPHPVKIVIAGNHDLTLDSKCAVGGEWEKEAGGGIPVKDVEAAQQRMCCRSAKKAGIHYLEYESVQLTAKNGRTWEVYGSPATPKYALGAFQYKYNTDQAIAIHSRIPPSTEILLTHTPPFGTLDLTRRAKNAGCPALAARLDSGELNRCRLHVYGHIHEDYGATVKLADGDNRERVSVNASMPVGYQATIVDLLN